MATQPTALPTISISAMRDHVGQQVRLQGWVANKRTGKGLAFIELRDGSGRCQAVCSEEKMGADAFDVPNKATQESSCVLEGEVVQDERQVGGYELHVAAYTQIGASIDYPISNKEHGVEFLADQRHLWLRSRRQWAIMRVRNTLIYSIHRFFQERGFIQMDAPIFTPNAAEGTTNLFETDFYGEPAYLSQSGQLYGEAMAMAMGKIYTFGPTFRAEKSKTRRHLSEFWMIEPEVAFADNEANMDLIEDFLRFVVLEAVDKCGEELGVIGRDLDTLRKIAEPFARMTYDDAIEVLHGKRDVNGRNAIALLEGDLAEAHAAIERITNDITERETKIATPGMKKGEIAFNQGKIISLRAELEAAEEATRNIPQWLESARNFQYGNDLGGSDETVLTRLFEVPLMVYNWPHEVKAFYMKRTDDGRFAKGVDVLAPEGFGEIIGGGERETNLEWLEEKIAEHGLPKEVFEWYLDLRRYGSVPHAGFGLGLERLVAYVCKLPHVRESIPFPRMYGRVRP
jgi:asparaginyl-tRNA synthetase